MPCVTNREAPRGWNFAGILGMGSLSLPTRTEGEKRLLSAMRNP